MAIQRTNAPRTNTGLFTRSKLNDFFKYDKIPAGTAVKCDELHITNLRTPLFIHNNIFGGDNLGIASMIVIKAHVLQILGDDTDSELVTENDYSFLVAEFCV